MMSDKSNEIEEAMKILIDNMKADSEIAWAWHCNIAVPMQDEGIEHILSNRAAARIMYNLFNIDITKHKHYQEIVERDK